MIPSIKDFRILPWAANWACKVSIMLEFNSIRRWRWETIPSFPVWAVVVVVSGFDSGVVVVVVVVVVDVDEVSWWAEETFCVWKFVISGLSIDDSLVSGSSRCTFDAVTSLGFISLPVSVVTSFLLVIGTASSSLTRMLTPWKKYARSFAYLKELFKIS